LGVSSGEKFLQTAVLGYIFVSLQKKTLIHNFLCIFENLGKNSSHKKMHYNYSKKMFTGRAKQTRIIGEPDNQRPDKWSSTVFDNLTFVS
jgi:hypothetical protein